MTHLLIKAAMLGGVLLGGILLSTSATAQYDYDSERYQERRADDARDRHDNRSRYKDDGRGYEREHDRRRPSYDYCRDRARDLTGYRGRTPSRYRGNAIEGAIKGGMGASAGSWLSGGDKQQIRKARERGAKLGFIIGAIKGAQAREQEREDDRRRRDYDYEVRSCMNDY